MMHFRAYAVLLAIAFSGSHCWAQHYTGQGAAVGGVTGAVIGGLIGKQNHKTTGGALIGGAVGAVAGGVMGRNYDNKISHERYAHQQAMYAQQQHFYTQQQAAVQAGVSAADVVSMNRSGISDSVIMSHLQSRGVQRRLEVSDIISLHQQGISDTVISAMQAAPVAAAYSQPAYPVQTRSYGRPVIVHPQPVIVHEPHVIYSGSPVIYEHYHTYPAYR